MLGRTLVPLTFNDGEKEIVVRDIKTLKEVFKKEFYTQLVAYLHNKRLERFFFAFGMDEIKETIENLKNSGKSDLEVINKVAELIGVEPISVELSESLSFAKRSNLLEELTDADQELRLVLSSYFLRAPELELRGSKVFKRETAGNTELAIAVSKLKGSKELVFENLILVMDGEVVFESFERVVFRNVRLKAEKPVRFINTSVELYGCDVVGCLWVKGTNLSAESSEFHNSNLSAIYSVGSSVVLRGCKIAKNKGGAEHEAQVRFSDSKVELLECEIAESESIGLIFEKSKVHISNCKVHENNLYGILVKGQTKINIKDSDIYENGSNQYSQIHVENSDALFKYSQIHNSKGGTGLVVSNSKCSLSECNIYENIGNGVVIKSKSELNMSCNVYKNGDGTITYPQVHILDSIVCIKDSQIHSSNKGNGLYILNSKVSLLKCKIYDNGGNGVYAGNKTRLNMEECIIYKNGKGGHSQVYIQDSRVVIDNSKIYESELYGVDIESGAVLLSDVRTYKNWRGVHRGFRASLAMYNCNIEDGSSP